MLALDGTSQTNVSNNITANDTTPDWQSVQGVITVGDFFFSPTTVKPKQGGALLWDFVGPAELHTATDNTGLGLFDSGPKAAGQYFVYLYPGAGSYAVYCTIHTSMTMTVKVPTTASPVVGNLTTQFTITWANAPLPGPFAYDFDVQVLRPGAVDWADWRLNQKGKSLKFTADGGTGVYSFKTRLSSADGLHFSDYSAPVSITVNP
jgi:plastocyanin